MDMQLEQFLAEQEEILVMREREEQQAREEESAMRRAEYQARFDDVLPHVPKALRQYCSLHLDRQTPVRISLPDHAPIVAGYWTGRGSYEPALRAAPLCWFSDYWSDEGCSFWADLPEVLSDAREEWQRHLQIRAEQERRKIAAGDDEPQAQEPTAGQKLADAFMVFMREHGYDLSTFP